MQLVLIEPSGHKHRVEIPRSITANKMTRGQAEELLRARGYELGPESKVLIQSSGGYAYTISEGSQ